MDVTDWSVYVILCTDRSLYTGITRDVRRRLAQHGGKRGARYFRGRKPLRVVYLEAGHSRSSASRREASIKKLSRAEKLQLIGPNACVPGGQPSGRASVVCSE
jgi:putative endonuclease